MMGHGAKFGRKKEEAIAALLLQPTVEKAARAINVGTKTLVRWMKLPEFDAAYRKARRDAYSLTIARLQRASSASVTTLVEIMMDKTAKASSRIRAAQCILEHAGRAFDWETVVEAAKEIPPGPLIVTIPVLVNPNEENNIRKEPREAGDDRRDKDR
jgi:hypothetical protein